LAGASTPDGRSKTVGDCVGVSSLGMENAADAKTKGPGFLGVRTRILAPDCARTWKPPTNERTSRSDA